MQTRSSARCIQKQCKRKVEVETSQKTACWPGASWSKLISRWGSPNLFRAAPGSDPRISYRLDTGTKFRPVAIRIRSLEGDPLRCLASSFHCMTSPEGHHTVGGAMHGMCDSLRPPVAFACPDGFGPCRPMLLVQSLDRASQCSMVDRLRLCCCIVEPLSSSRRIAHLAAIATKQRSQYRPRLGLGTRVVRCSISVGLLLLITA